MTPKEMQEIQKKFSEIHEADWVREMREHRARTGGYRPQDLRRLLGDPNKRVEMGPETSIKDYVARCAGTLVEEYSETAEAPEAEDTSAPHLFEFRIVDVPYRHKTLHFRTPIVLEPSLSDSEGLICLEYPELGIDVFAATREELLTELQEQIVMLWEEYALEDDSRLSAPAIELKNRLRAAIEEIDNAEG